MADDGSMKLFDIAENKSTPKRVINAAHSDRIRCGCASKFSSHLFVSGSYDHSAKVWDIRADEEERDAEDDEQDVKPLVSVEHDAPIEAVVLLNGDAILATAGGVAIKIWDIASGGRFLLALKHHHKTITSMCLASKGSRLISGGLDKKINIYHTDTPDYALIHSISLAAPVYAVAVSDDDQSMAVGMANLLAIFRRDPAGQHEQTLKEAKETGAGLEHSKTIRVAAPAPKERQRGGVTLDVELTAPLAPKIRLGKIDVLLRQYKHWKVVDVLFRNRHFWENNPDLVVAALTEVGNTFVVAI
ncbi:unnamed protein product [Anisakis simplex]|uniref:U3 small nucleolar RNA-associated protein 15 homolog (inferred by orthology to a human protein) n=1 Tax=Anisakis simplex TaxID=6269 RepID=A0A0M3J840_ANISI|nr:unnamed protein product [Anisakis simplex]